MNYLLASKMPAGVIELINEYRNVVKISKTWKDRHKVKIAGSTEPEIRIHALLRVQD